MHSNRLFFSKKWCSVKFNPIKSTVFSMLSMRIRKSFVLLSFEPAIRKKVTFQAVLS